MKSQCRSRGLGLFILIAFHLSWPRWSAACTNQARRIRYVVRPVVGGDRSVIPALEAAYHRLPADSEFRSHIAKPLAPPVELLLPPLPPIVPTGLSFFSFLSFFLFCLFLCFFLLPFSFFVPTASCQAVGSPTLSFLSGYSVCGNCNRWRKLPSDKSSNSPLEVTMQSNFAQ